MNSFDEIKSDAFEIAENAGAFFNATPMTVVRNMTMTIEEKRSLLASWASDERQVEDRPALRRLDSGRYVEIDDILEALKQLDELSTDSNSPRTSDRSYLRNRKSRLGFLGRRRGADDDDDPPTPAPAAIRPRPPILDDGAAALAAVAA